ncbi:Polyadenylate-binding protein-interacting protein 8 [Diplonema papillatum]|nr:Polyadenylate-binding protein-interacting protein 8 [Diplonema papillatum]
MTAPETLIARRQKADGLAADETPGLNVAAKPWTPNPPPASDAAEIEAPPPEAGGISWGQRQLQEPEAPEAPRSTPPSGEGAAAAAARKAEEAQPAAPEAPPTGRFSPTLAHALVRACPAGVPLAQGLDIAYQALRTEVGGACPQAPPGLKAARAPPIDVKLAPADDGRKNQYEGPKQNATTPASSPSRGTQFGTRKPPAAAAPEQPAPRRPAGARKEPTHNKEAPIILPPPLPQQQQQQPRPTITLPPVPSEDALFQQFLQSALQQQQHTPLSSPHPLGNPTFPQLTPTSIGNVPNLPNVAALYPFYSEAAMAAGLASAPCTLPAELQQLAASDPCNFFAKQAAPCGLYSPDAAAGFPQLAPSAYQQDFLHTPQFQAEYLEYEQALLAMVNDDLICQEHDDAAGVTPGEKTVYIVGIDSATSDLHVLTRLSQFGRIKKYQLCGDPLQVTRYGFFEYNASAAARACQTLDGKRMFGRPIRVSKAKDVIKGGRTVPDALQLDVLRSAAVCRVQGVEAPCSTAQRIGPDGGGVGQPASPQGSANFNRRGAPPTLPAGANASPQDAGPRWARREDKKTPHELLVEASA